MTRHKTASQPRTAWIGVDLGGTQTRFTLFDDKFRALSDVRYRTPLRQGEKYFLNRFLGAIRRLEGAARKSGLRPAGIGMGCPGFVDETRGMILSAPNIVFLKNYPIRAKVEAATGLPLTILNDVQAGLYGEQFLGAARGARNAIALFLGTGVGGALIVEGKLYRGSSGAAGEIGQFLINPIGPLSGSDRHGVLDEFVGRHAIAAGAAVLAAKHWAPKIFQQAETDVSRIKSDVMAKAIASGDKKVEELVRSRSRLVGIVLANLVNFLSPDLVLLGGGLTEAMPGLIASEVRSAIRDFALPWIARKTEIRIAALKGRSVTVGAAKLARDQAAAGPARARFISGAWRPASSSRTSTPGLSRRTRASRRRRR